MAGRKVFSEQDARRCLSAVKASGGELGEWAREHGIDGRSLNLWRMNLERRGVQPVRAGPPKLVELVVARPAVVGPKLPFLLRIGEVELEVGEHFDEGALRRLVGVLKSC
jgi:transposase-like protein